MKIIIPMAGKGTRLRPHTLTTPKPLIPIAGKAIVHRLVEDLVKVCPEPIEEIGFVIGEVDKEIENRLKDIAESVGAKCRLFKQEVALGTAHAVLCAKELLGGNVIVAFADLLFKADFKLDTNQDGIIWVKQVEDPSSFGVVQIDDNNTITAFIEKPETPVSDLAIIGIYYFKEGKELLKELNYLVENKIMNSGEYQLTAALENMKNKGTKFVPGKVIEWLDCGNKDATVNTNKRYLEYIREENLISPTAQILNTIIKEPVYIGENVRLNNTVIGPHVSIGKNTVIENSIVRNSIIQENTTIRSANLTNSMLGNHVNYSGVAQNVSVGDYNSIKY